MAARKFLAMLAPLFLFAGVALGEEPVKEGAAQPAPSKDSGVATAPASKEAATIQDGAGPSVRTPGAGVEAKADEKKNPWNGSQFIYEHAASAISFDKGAELTWNPYWVHSLSFRPAWKFHELLTVEGRFDLEQELTNSDETTLYHEWVWSDVLLDFKTPGWTESRTGIQVVPGVRLQVPTSKLAHAQTLILGLAPGVSLKRKFDVLKGITVSFGGRWTQYFDRYTTMQADAPTIACGSSESSECGRFMHEGTRNAFGRIAYGPMVLIDPIDKLEVSISWNFRRDFLYPLTAGGANTFGGSIDPATASDYPYRNSQWAILDVSYQALDYLGVSLGASTLYPELAPDSTRYFPFFNRNTNLYLDLTLDVDALVSKL